ncbi:MAG: hypothetical protein WAR39_05415 [Prevotella sp.]
MALPLIIPNRKPETMPRSPLRYRSLPYPSRQRGRMVPKHWGDYTYHKPGSISRLPYGAGSIGALHG